MGKWTGGITWNPSRTVKALGIIAFTITSITIIQAKCNNGIIYAQEKFVRSEAVEVFDSLHRPFETRLCALADTIGDMRDQTRILVEMMKMANSDKPDLYRDAKNRVMNSGRFVE